MRENIGIYRGKRKDMGEWKEGYLHGVQDRLTGKDLFFIVDENNESHKVDPETFATTLDCMPTIGAEPVKHAKWYAPASYEPCEWCSNCNERTRWFFDKGYCPNCGAKMEGDQS